MQQRHAPELIRQLRARSDITQEKLAKILGITQQAVSEYERGKVAKERYDVIKKLETLLSNAIIEEVQREAKGLSAEGEARVKSIIVKRQHTKKKKDDSDQRVP